MFNRADRNDISVGFRALAMIVLAIPINIIMTLVSAFTGDDEPRRHHARAIIIALAVLAVVVTLALFGGSPRFLENLKQLLPAG
jgi:hypothetical protein